MRKVDFFLNLKNYRSYKEAKFIIIFIYRWSVFFLTNYRFDGKHILNKFWIKAGKNNETQNKTV